MLINEIERYEHFPSKPYKNICSNPIYKFITLPVTENIKKDKFAHSFKKHACMYNNKKNTWKLKSKMQK